MKSEKEDAFIFLQYEIKRQIIVLSLTNCTIDVLVSRTPHHFKTEFLTGVSETRCLA